MMDDQQENCVEAAFSRSERKLVAYAFSILRCLETARDEAQQAFLKLARSDCPSIVNHEAWLVAVCRNSCLRLLARGKRQQNVDPDFWNSLEDASEKEAAEVARKKERITALLQTMETLSEKQREVIRLIYLVGLKPSAVAEVLETKANNVYQLHFAALEQLRKQVGARPA